MFVVGLTGGIGSGKTTVTDMFIELGAEVIDADVISRQSVAPGSIGLAKLVENFSEDILLAGTMETTTHKKLQLDRQKLRTLIFNDPSAKQTVEDIIHPLVRSAIHEELSLLSSSKTHPYIILSSPLLFETRQDTLTDINVVVDISPENQVSRTVKRDNTNAEEIKKIIESQLSRQERLEKAQYHIDNSHSIQNTRDQVTTLHKQFLSMARAKEIKT